MERTPPDPTVALRRNIQHSLRQGRLTDAEAALRRLQQEDPLALQTRGLELELLIRQNHLAEAESLAVQLLDAFPASARIHYLAGRAAYRAKRYPTSIARFSESLRIADHWKTRQWLGKGLTQNGQLDEAEPLLVEAAESHVSATRDLAWLYERMGETERAIAALDRLLQAYPDDDTVATQRQRLLAGAMDPNELLAEVDGLVTLGEPVPAHILPETLRTLIERGELARARELAKELDVSEHPQEATRAAWFCHRAHAPDLAYELFVATFDHNQHSPKFFTALEADALRAGLGADLLEIYRERAPANPRLWGRLRRLEKRLQ